MNKTAIEIRRYSGEVERHCHDYHQVILPCSGVLEMEMEHHTGRVSGSVGSFVPAGGKHAFLASKADAFIVLDVPTRIGAQRLDDGAVPAFFSIGADIRGLIDYATVNGLQDHLAPQLQDAWSTLLLDRLAGPVVHPDRAEMVVRRAVDFIKQKLADPVSVGDIADAAGVSASRLHDAFQKRRGVTPHGLLVSLRLDFAEQLLANPSLSIAEIAVRTGHADQSGMTRAMRRERGTTPAELRRRLLGNFGEEA